MAGYDPLSFDRKDLNLERKMHIRAAKDLCYPTECIEKFKVAKSGAEMDRIMADARRKKYNV